MTSDHHSCKPHPAYAKLINNHHTLPAAKPGNRKQHDANATPTHIFTGNIVTMDETNPRAEAIAIHDNHIVAVGSRADLQNLAGPHTVNVDLGDTVMYPGLIESHMHVWVSAINYDWIDCSAFTNDSLDAIKQKIATAASTTKPGEWILGKLYDPSMLPGSPDLTTADLDPIAPNNPVFILNASMHFAYVNTAALELSGITKASADPVGGLYKRDSNGQPNGVLSEMAAITPVMQHINGISPDVITKNISRVTEDAAQVGVTTMREAGTGAIMGAKEIPLLHHLQQNDALKTRLSLGLFDEDASKWPADPTTEYGSGDDYVWVGARKIVADGSNQGESGYQTKPYLHSKDRGKLDLSAEVLRQRITELDAEGWQIMVHANGDAAVDAVTKAYHTVLSKAPKRDARHRIEHCSLVNDDARFNEMAAVGVTPSFLINHVYLWGKTLRDNILGPERIGMLDRTAAALKAGLKFTMHSDYNVSPINPLHYVKVAATRTLWNSTEVLGADQIVSVYDALKAVTIDAAWQIHADDRLGSLTPGKFADFTILSDDPQAIPAEEIDNIIVEQTWVGGKPTFQKAS